MNRAALAFLLFSLALRADEPSGARLPDTAALDLDGDLSTRMMDGLHRFAEAKIAASVQERPNHWRRDLSSAAAYARSIEPNRAHLAGMIGLVDPRTAVRLEHFGAGRSAGLAGSSPLFRAYQVRWSVLEGVDGEGLLLEPERSPLGAAVALADADQTPEQIAGLAAGIPPAAQFARRLAENGFRVIVPALVDRDDSWSGNEAIAFTNQPHREWIYRQAYHMGRHILGYEVAKVLAAAEWLRGGGAAKVGVAGYGEGGLVAFYAAAVDAGVDACLVSGAFDPQERPWEEPLYRNLFGFKREFGAAEVASLISPRGLVVEYSAFPNVTGPPPVREGRRGAAAGALRTPAFAAVEAELKRARTLVPPDVPEPRLVSSGGAATGPGSREALAAFAALLGVRSPMTISATPPREARAQFAPRERAQRQVRQLEAHVQKLLVDADARRDRLFLTGKFSEARQLAPHMERAREYRRYVRQEVLGEFSDPLLPPNPRSRRVYDRPKWTGYDVVLDVFPDVLAWGVLLLPKDLAPGERRPVVVCQHGRGVLPKDTIEGDAAAYHDFAARLADRGFIVFAPHNPYRGEDRYRFLSRKANAVKATLFSFILAQHEQILRWLASLPNVDPDRIAFYGLSYGGETAVRVPPLLERYCLSICSADFNDWARKVVSTANRYSFMFTIEWEMPYFDMGRTASYAELAALMIPRPFMVERGHADPVAPDEWVAYEYARVRRLYDQLGLGDRTEIEFFDGGHTIHGEGTFRFLEKHLNWPKK